MQEQRLQATVLFTLHLKCSRISELHLKAKRLSFQAREMLLSTLRRRLRHSAQRLLHFPTQTVIFMMKTESTLMRLRKSRRLTEAELRNILSIVPKLNTPKARVFGQSSAILRFPAQHRTSLHLTMQKLSLQTVASSLQKAQICRPPQKQSITSRQMVYYSFPARQPMQLA